MSAEGVETPFSCSLQIRDGSRGVIALVGELDDDTVDEARAAFDRSLALDFSELTVDVSRLEFLAASGLGVIASTAARMADRGGKVELVGASPLVLRLAAIARLDEVITVRPVPGPPCVTAVEAG